MKMWKQEVFSDFQHLFFETDKFSNIRNILGGVTISVWDLHKLRSITQEKMTEETVDWQAKLQILI